LGNVNTSIVVPVYRSEECVHELVAKLTEALQASGRSHEIVLVNDSSPDESWDKIVEAAARFPTVVGINLRRNFGQDSALMAGLNAAQGRVIVIMDDDLQHDPRDMEKLIRKVEEGFDVCYARFTEKKHAWWKNVGSWFNDKVANAFLGKPRHVYMSPFKAISHEVVDEIVKYGGPFPYVDGLIFRVTGNITQVDAEHHDRYAGRSNYNLRKSISVWLKLATSFSLVPLRIATCLGFAFAGLGFLLAILFVVLKLLKSGAPLGWASTIVSVLILGGVQLVCLGMVGEYLGRVFLHLNRRPQYVVKETTERGRDADALAP